MGKAFFITGTDTEVGKTYFGASLASALKESGYSVGVFKPLESGCKHMEGQAVPGDAATLKDASGCEEDLSVICPFCFEEPITPCKAAKINEIQVDPEIIVKSFEKIEQAHDVTLVEGAGGVLSPMFNTWTVMDVIRRLDLPVINVVGSRLGAINHTLLTERAVLDENLRLIGHVLNNFHGTDDPAVTTNQEMIDKFAGCPILGVLPKGQGPWLEPKIFTGHFDLACLGLD